MIGNKTGKLGEDIAALFLERRGFHVKYRNYWKPYGEIDLICEKAGKLHFIEVKTVSCLPAGTAHENYHAEQNVHRYKLKRLGRVIQSFLMKREYKDMDWQFDICVVTIDNQQKKAKVKLIENELLPE
ncbi:MAG TPA: YraN family protein [Candidatus Paceibacterota bacterium]